MLGPLTEGDCGFLGGIGLDPGCWPEPPCPGITICSSCWRLLLDAAPCPPCCPIMLLGVLDWTGEGAELAGLIGLGDMVAGEGDACLGPPPCEGGFCPGPGCG